MAGTLILIFATSEIKRDIKKLMYQSYTSWQKDQVSRSQFVCPIKENVEIHPNL